ncbi:FAD/NAD(P)-binding domain-containing protein [Mycena sanguinolenta]|uniref:FAD/NAD(P)-binding domain-containing protein n=1 Tax=Mycena sanguinolenta TaxID=230812 RepID=A0A8H6XF54_9AGAR|nr:FAD/NAD(P)-binding domain-containing protein [Mycena sanguinolenta]
MPHIVIVGGGTGGGSTVARALSSKLPSAKITLINPRPYAIALPTLPRMTVSEGNDLLDTALIPYDKLFTNPNGTFVQGVVETIRPETKGGKVVLADGQELTYDVLVLAPGSNWEGPLNFPQDSAAVKEIVLVGGGAVGVEFSGELKDEFPGKEITIVHGDKTLLNPTYPVGFRKGLEKSIRARGINIILSDYVDEIPAPGPASITTRNGKEITADLFVSTRGPRPNTAFVATSLGRDTLDERGQIKVNPTLQLPKHPDIFAIGDAINYVEQKQVMKAMAHASIVVGNIVAHLSGKPLKPYKGSSEMIVVTNGKNGGKAFMGILWGLTFGDWFARMVKSKTLMVSMTRSGMGH